MRAWWMPRWSPPGEISRAGCWTWHWDGYLYIGDTALGLAWEVLTGWRDDRNLAG